MLTPGNLELGRDLSVGRQQYFGTLSTCVSCDEVSDVLPIHKSGLKFDGGSAPLADVCLAYVNFESSLFFNQSKFVANLHSLFLSLCSPYHIDSFLVWSIPWAYLKPQERSLPMVSG